MGGHHRRRPGRGGPGRGSMPSSGLPGGVILIELIENCGLFAHGWHEVLPAEVKLLTSCPWLASKSRKLVGIWC